MAKKLYLVAGHGGTPYDPGAVGCGYKEADITRKIANTLYELLKGKIDIEVYNTSKDLFVSQEYSKFTKDSYVLEIHLNSAVNMSAKGTELLIYTGYSPDAYDKAILAVMAKYFTNRGIKKQSLRNAKNFASRGIAYSLLEVCFICNQSDMNILMNKYDTITQDLALTLSNLFGGKEVNNNNGSNSSANTDKKNEGKTNTGTIHTVVKGDTMTAIAKKYNMSLADLLSLNPQIKNQNEISIGQKITVGNADTAGYKIKVTASNGLNVRKGPGTEYPVATTINKNEVYTIISQRNSWGELKSGAGWIHLDYTEKL